MVKKITGIIAVTITVILTVFSVVLNPENIKTMMDTYGPEYVVGALIGEFLLILLFCWIVEKIYSYIHGLAKKKSQPNKEKREVSGHKASGQSLEPQC